ncbi:hypothetical protein AC579_9338 [Pseudocercospora musae]|uniref:Uncharacterized protein n=1 Tax=Pseudocercospora musae TaxID=113226 RepID=A0A139HZP9_9PEZI|nr:hypothetical protein AC579_9338 [Pseudocercospora musae]
MATRLDTCLCLYPSRRVKDVFEQNTFQAGYCYDCDLDIVIDWLKTIGAENREKIGKFVSFDANRKHDRNMPQDLTKTLRSEVVRAWVAGSRARMMEKAANMSSASDHMETRI